MILLVLDLIQILGLTGCFPPSRVYGLGCSHPLGQLVLVVSLCLVHMLFVCPILCQGNWNLLLILRLLCCGFQFFPGTYLVHQGVFILCVAYRMILLVGLCCFSFLAHLAIGHVNFLSSVSVRPSVSFSHLNLLLWNSWTEISQTCQKCSLDGPLPDLCFWCWFEIQHGCQGP